MTHLYKSPEEIRKELKLFFEQEYGVDILNQSPDDINNLDGNPYRANIVSIIQDSESFLHSACKRSLYEYISIVTDSQKALALTEILASINTGKVSNNFEKGQEKNLLCRMFMRNISRFGQEAEYITLAKKYMNGNEAKIILNYAVADNTARKDILDFIEKPNVMLSSGIERAIKNKNSRRAILGSIKVHDDNGVDNHIKKEISKTINKHLISCCDNAQDVEQVLFVLDVLTSDKEPQLRNAFLKNVNENFTLIKGFFYSNENDIPVFRKICTEITDLYENGNLDNINYEVLLNNKPKKVFENFEEFANWTRKFSERALVSDGVNFDELNENELKSKAILGRFDKEELFLDNISLDRDEIRAKALYGALSLLDEALPYENKLWSREAAKINDSQITQSLIDLVKRKYNINTGAEADNYKNVYIPEDLLLPWAFNNNQVWDAFENLLSEARFSKQSVFSALVHTPKIDSKLYPLMKQTLGEDFTKAYLESKELIDLSPRKDLFISKLYATTKKGGFPITKEAVIETINFCRQANRIKKLIRQEIEQDNKKLKKCDFRLIRDIIDCAPKDIAQVEKLVDYFYDLNQRPEVYGSSFNHYYPQDIYPIIQKGFPDWMDPVVFNACQIGVINKERLGAQKDLFDACKTWKINPYIWKKEAVAIGKMPLPMRMIAGGIYAKLQAEIQPNMHPQTPLTKEHRERFWQDMKVAQEMGYERAIQTYVKDSRINRKRVVNLLFGSRLSSHEEATLIEYVSIKNLSTLKTGAFHKAVNVLLDIEWKNAGYGNRVSDVYRKNITKLETDEKNEHTIYVKNEDGYDIDFKSFYNEQKDWLLPASVSLARVFGKTFPEYIKKTTGYVSLHDAVYWLPKDLSDEKNKSLAEFIHKNIIYADVKGKKNVRDTAEMEIIAKNWQSLSNAEENMKFKDVLAICRSKKYENQKYPNFAEEAAKWGVPEAQYKTLENYYEIGLNTPVPVDTHVVFAKDNLVGRFLPRSDVRVGFFGNYTGCCQHFDGVGRQCAISSVKDSFSQLFVVENKKGEIIAGSWVWTNKKTFKDVEGNKKNYKTITFDNIEAKLSYQNEDAIIKEIYQEAGAYLTKKNFRQVTIGSANSDIDLSDFETVKIIPLNPLYTGYSDANESQFLLAENKEAQPIDNTNSELYIAGASEEDFKSLQDIAFQCFPEGDRDLQIPDIEPRAMLLKDNDKVVGYIIWTENETATALNGKLVKNRIYDLAVLPEYRKGKVSGSLLLLNEMMKHVKDVGGEWGAELRDKTSLKYMQFMADKVKNGEIAGISNDFEGRCMIDLEILAQDRTMSDGSKVYEVNFSPLSKEEQTQRLKQRELRKKSVSNSSLLKIKSLLGKMHKEAVPSVFNSPVLSRAMDSRRILRGS